MSFLPCFYIVFALFSGLAFLFKTCSQLLEIFPAVHSSLCGLHCFISPSLWWWLAWSTSPGFSVLLCVATLLIHPIYTLHVFPPVWNAVSWLFAGPSALSLWPFSLPSPLPPIPHSVEGPWIMTADDLKFSEGPGKPVVRPLPAFTTDAHY